MATGGRPTISKRQRELAQQRKKREKAERRAQRRSEQGRSSPLGPNDEDPDIAGIVPGPQPLPWDDDPPGDDDPAN